MLSGYLSWEVLRLAGLRELARVRSAASRERKQLPKSKRHKEPKEQPYRLRSSHAFVALALIVIFALFTVIPYTKVDLYGTGTAQMVSAIDYAKRTADLIPDEPRYEPPEAWCDALTWLRENTPEPFDGSDLYYARYDRPFDYSGYPEAYGVTAWWDYGYWIVRIGHRPPSQNPGGVIPAVAEFFLAQNETDGQKVLDARGARYVILDYEFITGKFYGAVSRHGRIPTGLL